VQFAWSVSGVKPESEEFERKSIYDGSFRQRLELVKTIVAMSNTKGGEIILESVEADRRHLDSASLDTFVNKYVEPRVVGITSDDRPLLGSVNVEVADSKNKPHVFTSTVSYKDENGRSHIVFHAGQVWVRHSSGNAEAKGDDMRRIVQEAASEFLSLVSTRMGEPGFVRFVESGQGMPVRVSEEPGATPIVLDIEGHYPYTAKSLGKKLGRNQNWVARAATVLRMREQQRLCYILHDLRGRALHTRYSEEAFRQLSELLARKPEWVPWRMKPCVGLAGQ